MLTEQQLEQYRRDGYILISEIFTTVELDEMERALDAIIDRRLKQQPDMNVTWGGDWKKDMPATKLLHTHDVQAHSAVWSGVLVHDRFTETLADIVGPNVQLHHTKAFIKPPEKGSAFPMHQDYPYFPHAKDTMTAAIIHLSDATEEMGCVCFYPGTHKLGELSAIHEGAHYLDPEKYPIEKATRCPARRGDVAIFNYLTVHGSDINRSQRTRKTVLVQFRDPTDAPLVDTHRSHAQGMMMRGIDPLEAQAATGAK